MKKITSKEIITNELAEGAIINTMHDGFPIDYLVLHCLLKQHKKYINKFLEIGTNSGMGTKIIKNALGNKIEVFSMDLPKDMQHVSEEHPKENLASKCDLPFKQILADSTKFDYSKLYPIDGFFIDAKHSYANVLHEAREAIKAKALLIIFHDTDIYEVYKAVVDAFNGINNYNLFRVTDCRISYAIRK